MTAPLHRLSTGVRQAAGRLTERLSPAQRQYVLLGGIVTVGVGLLWLIFAANDGRSPTGARKPASGTPGPVTNLGVMPPGQQVSPVDQWVGTAGSKLAQYESERDEQTRLNRDRQAFEARTMQRFAELEQRLMSATQAAQGIAPPPGSTALLPPLPAPPTIPPSAGTRPIPAVPPLPPISSGTSPSGLPPAASLPLPLAQAAGNAPGSSATPSGLPTINLPGLTNLPGLPGPTGQAPGDGPAPAPLISRITLVDRSAASTIGVGPVGQPGTPTGGAPTESRTVSTWLPVSFTRGTLLGGLDAPTGGQAQSNPHPVLIRLADNAVLPNRFRGEIPRMLCCGGRLWRHQLRAGLPAHREPILRAGRWRSAGGQDPGQRVRRGRQGRPARPPGHQGRAVAGQRPAGRRGQRHRPRPGHRVVQRQHLAAGSIASATGTDAYRAGLGAGVGNALDRLARYYIKLAENTFPVIEVDAGREVDVVLTKGVRIDVPMDGSANAAGTGDNRAGDPQALRRPSNLEASDDANY